MSKKLLCLIVLPLLVLTAVQTVVRADNGPEHKAIQSWPIKLGTSGGNINDRSSLYCCSGTLGALVQDGESLYILSNNHVLARSNLGIIGEAINQPGQIDQKCQQSGIVATLSDFVKIRFRKGRAIPINTVDAAIAIVVDGAVDPNGAILDINELSSDIIAPELGQAVQKSGRTSGHTKGIVTAINVTVDVGYSRECAGAPNQKARFSDQIFIEGTNEAFSTGGDGGSLIVEDLLANPRAVGLLFAGGEIDGTDITIANPIAAVLNAFGVVMHGGTSPDPDPELDPTLTGSISGIVTNDSTGAAIAGAAVSTTAAESITDANGTYLLSDVSPGDQQVTASATGFRDRNKTVTVVADATVNADFALRVRKGGRGNKTNRGSLRRALGAKNRHVNRFMNIDGVVGVGVGLSKAGQPVVKIYLAEDSDKVKKQIPPTLDDVPVEAVVTGTFEAY